MIKSHMNCLFYPKKIAVIGATNKEDKVGHIIFKRLTSLDIDLYPVHPKEDEVLGYKVTNNINDLPKDIDITVITIGAENAVNAAEECGKIGVKNIVIVAGGFGEIGEEGKILEERLSQIPKTYGSRVLGPNSLGVFMPDTGLDTIFVEHGDKALSSGGRIAFITQSGSVGVEALGLASNSGYGMRAFVGLGNKIDLDELDFLDYFGKDEKTNSIALYCESINSGKKFLEHAASISKEKPVVMLKAGRTSAGISAVSSHTGKLAGSDRVINGAFKQFGVQRAYDDEELCDASKVLSMVKLPKGNRIAIITAAGGYGVMCADYVEEENSRGKLQMAEFSEETKQRIKEANFAFASNSNPVDITASAGDTEYIGTLKAILEDEGVDIVICITFFAPPAITENLIKEISTASKGSDKSVLVFTQYGPYTDSYLKKFHDFGLAGFPSIYRTVRAARFLIERSNLLKSMEVTNER